MPCVFPFNWTYTFITCVRLASPQASVWQLQSLAWLTSGGQAMARSGPPAPQTPPCTASALHRRALLLLLENLSVLLALRLLDAFLFEGVHRLLLALRPDRLAPGLYARPALSQLVVALHRCASGMGVQSRWGSTYSREGWGQGGSVGYPTRPAG